MRTLNFLFRGLVVVLSLLCSCSGQSQTTNLSNKIDEPDKKIGGDCDGCELMYVGMPKTIRSSDTSAGWFENGQKLIVSGVVYKLDGVTPAADVILYYWQTDSKGYYAPDPSLNIKASRHGKIRGWVKTDKNGRYQIYTNRPAPYPDRSEPAHIHISLKEPAIRNEYYIDELVFDDDVLLLEKRRKQAFENRGGSGILRVLLRDDVQVAEHIIVLGLNIPKLSF